MDTPVLLDLQVPRTLDAWVRQFEAPPWRGASVEGWLFEGPDARRAAEQRLRAAGVRARLRSAYKPLVHSFLEDVDCARLVAVHLTYPAPAHAAPRRFLLEAYPLAGLLPAGCTLQCTPGGEDLHYQLDLTYGSGERVEARVFAPNRVHTDHLGSTQLSPTGWLRTGAPQGGGAALDGPQATDCEQLFDHAVRTVQQHPWPVQEPYFERLDLRVDLPGIELPLAVDHECISLAEALHEDLYFSLLEVFQRHSGRAASDRRLQPGQIVPDVRHGAPAVRIALQPFAAQAQDRLGPPPEPLPGTPLERLAHPAHPQRIAAEMARLPGLRFAAASRQGRAVLGLYHRGPGAAVFISGGQHANETSGVVGALRAAQQLQSPGSANFALIALENPDGYALHRELCVQHPRHMQHAARYSALGDDIEYREQAPLYERAAREQALALSGAQLHVNLHGYPAHEWTRPLTGYVPRGFGLWTIPKGFFLILRHRPGWQAEGRALLEQVCAALARVPGLSAYNARQMALYAQHAGELPFEQIQGFACTQSENPLPGPPVTLITEFPDETVADGDFRFAHTVQCAAVLAAVQAWQGLARPAAG
ncbi:peptidase M14 [Acidovorax sp. SRB_14]|uniref:peptidase M14 n=1 Tax=Acidovorax sp. SRB_14 TaxID=1962699 RepID=UPI00156329F7|nr:peptidase M14 [Acidovorax sp. SRB_14]NMM80087.1 peptidase M14 [Acidovorax sp. SRB_14]